MERERELLEKRNATHTAEYRIRNEKEAKMEVPGGSEAKTMGQREVKCMYTENVLYENAGYAWNITKTGRLCRHAQSETCQEQVTHHYVTCHTHDT